MVHHVGANVVVDVIENAVVAVDGGQATPQVAPLLHRRRNERAEGRKEPAQALVLYQHLQPLPHPCQELVRNTCQYGHRQ